MTVTSTLNGRQFRRLNSTFTRPNDTTQYAAGDLVANNTAAGSVTPLSWATTGSRPFRVPRVRLQKSTASVTSASFRLHLFDGLPTFTSSGDNGVLATVVATGVAKWLGSFSGTMAAAFADGAVVDLLPTPNYVTATHIGDPGTLYGLLEATATYTPGAQEVFNATMYFEFDQ